MRGLLQPAKEYQMSRDFVDHLENIETTADAVKRAEIELRRAVIDAEADGLSIAEIARTAGVTRQTIYRWMAQGAELPKYDVSEALDEAMTVMQPYVGKQVSASLMQRLQSDDIRLKITGVEMAHAGMVKRVDGEEAGIIAIGCQVALEAKKIHKRTGRWPSEVIIHR